MNYLQRFSLLTRNSLLLQGFGLISIALKNILFPLKRQMGLHVIESSVLIQYLYSELH